MCGQTPKQILIIRDPGRTLYLYIGQYRPINT
nr:MAG TPA: Tumor necrosis factor ligand superfamily, cytokine, CRD, receptor, jelly-roll.9A [Bacteriophage sp.]